MEALLWLLFASIGLWFVGVFVIAVAGPLGAFDWLSERSSKRSTLAAGDLTVTVVTDPLAVFFIWTTLAALIPIGLLAIWALAVEVGTGRVGGALAFSALHLYFLWKLMQLGTRVQRRVEFSRTGVLAQPVIGSARHIEWSAITRVNEVRYIGPGASGLSLRDASSGEVFIDRWLPRHRELEAIVRDHTPHASWTRIRRGVLIS